MLTMSSHGLLLLLLLPLASAPAAGTMASVGGLAPPPTATASSLPGRTFGTAYKGWYKPCLNSSGQQNLWPFSTELDVFEHQCGSKGGSVCVMKHLWCGGVWPGYADSRIRYYVDGEAASAKMAQNMANQQRETMLRMRELQMATAMARARVRFSHAPWKEPSARPQSTSGIVPRLSSVFTSTQPAPFT